MDLVARLTPLLKRARGLGFNVFDVMRHGTHEKQISNVFGWLLDPQGTHELGDSFQRAFIAEVNLGLSEHRQLGFGPYTVAQEVNTAYESGREDIADIVLQSDKAMIVVENYFTSDGHGHSYEGYLRYATQGGRRGVVVLLCDNKDISRQTEGWESAVVVTYRTMLAAIHQRILSDTDYQRRNPDAYSFINQLNQSLREGMTVWTSMMYSSSSRRCARRARRGDTGSSRKKAPLASSPKISPTRRASASAKAAWC